MADDLSHAKASADWAISNLDGFQGRLSTWIDNNVEMIREDTNPHGSHFTLAVIQRAEIPLSFSVEAGAYINAIRSSLDILATALAHRYGVARSDKAYFPIAKSAAEFESGSGFKGHEFVMGLPDHCRDILRSLQPYRGGNDNLVLLHDMDIERKHKSLLRSVFTVYKFRINNLKNQNSLNPSKSGFLRFGNKIVLGEISKSETNPELVVHAYIAFDEAFFPRGKRVIDALGEFGNLANSIIRRFET